jgi:hypothetical protein
MRRIAVAVGTIHRDFHVVACGRIDNRVVLQRPGGERRFGLVELSLRTCGVQRNRPIMPEGLRLLFGANVIKIRTPTFSSSAAD